MSLLIGDSSENRTRWVSLWPIGYKAGAVRAEATSFNTSVGLLDSSCRCKIEEEKVLNVCACCMLHSPKLALAHTL